MSNEITEVMRRGYKGTVGHLLQQTDARLSGFVRHETQSSVADFYDFIGTVDPILRTTRHGDTPYTPTPHTRRMCTMADYEANDYIDDFDLVRTLSDPSNEYVQAQVNGFHRKQDSIIYTALGADVMTGETGSTLVTASGDGVSTVTCGSGLTVAKLREISLQMSLDNNPVSDGRVIVCTYNQIDDLLADTDIKTIDVNTVKPLVAGTVHSFMGFHFVPIDDDLTTLVSTTRTCYAFNPKKVLMAMSSKGLASNITERPDKSYTTQAYTCMTAGALRLEGAGVVELAVTE